MGEFTIMATSTLNISLPETMREFVEEKIKNEGYGTISEYVRELIREQQRNDQSKFDAMILEGINSGEATELTKADIEEARRIVKERILNRGKSTK